MSIPSVCESCGTAFKSRMFQVIGGRGLFARNSEPCPFCGGRAWTIDGEYDFVGSDIVRFKPLNRQERRRLQTALDRAKAGKMSEADFLQAISEVSPEIAAITRRALGGQRGMAVGMALLLLILQRCGGGDLNMFNSTEINNIYLEACAEVEAVPINVRPSNPLHADKRDENPRPSIAPGPPSIKPKG